MWRDRARCYKRYVKARGARGERGVFNKRRSSRSSGGGVQWESWAPGHAMGKALRISRATVAYQCAVPHLRGGYWARRARAEVPTRHRRYTVPAASGSGDAAPVRSGGRCAAAGRWSISVPCCRVPIALLWERHALLRTPGQVATMKGVARDPSLRPGLAVCVRLAAGSREAGHRASCSLETRTPRRAPARQQSY